MPQAKPSADSDQPKEDHRKPYEVIAKGHRHNGKDCEVGDEIRLGPGQATMLLGKKVVKEVKA